ncbi:MAG: hypothetical protein U0270_06290 [Labilithrix sp.]
MRSKTLLGLLALVGSTFVVACAATPAPDSFDNGQPSSASRSNKKSAADDTEGDTGNATPPASTGTMPDRPTPAEPTAPPVQASDTVWTGTLAKTVTSKFGGSPYCEYQTHFENMNVKVVIGPDGKVKSATVTGKAVEESLNGCPNSPIPANLHDYSLTTAADGTTFSIDGGGSAAEPHAKLDADVSAAGASGSISLKIQRNDQTAPLVWTINADVPLTKQP